MILPARMESLAKLNPKHRMRKCASTLMGSERRLVDGQALDLPYLAKLAAFLASCEDIPHRVRAAAASASDLFANPACQDPRRALNELKHALLAEIGIALADWDLMNPKEGLLDGSDRSLLPGTALYLEDIRSPFNVGTIFRSAEAFGLESLIISPHCADPRHPRALRSAMGCVESLAWERRELLPGPDLENCFALELGGTDIGDFEFPQRGTCVLGSEELGIRPETLDSCGLGRVSIPLCGAKASLNVAVACGILLEAWTRSIRLNR